MPFWGKGSSSGGDGPNVASDSTSPSSTSSPESTPSSKPALTREQQADLDLRELLAALDSQSTAEEATRAKAQRASPTSGTQSYKYHPTSAEKKKIADEDFETGFKTEMNCLQAFDQVWYCYSLGGQFLNGLLPLPFFKIEYLCSPN